MAQGTRPSCVRLISSSTNRAPDSASRTGVIGLVKSRFGFRELTFDVFVIARERVPRLRDNPQAERRFAAIRDHVESKGGLGVIDADLLARMKRFLRGEDEPER